MKYVQATGVASSPQKTTSSTQNIKFLHFFVFWVTFSLRIRISGFDRLAILKARRKRSRSLWHKGLSKCLRQGSKY
jgi:hypothetical protein